LNSNFAAKEDLIQECEKWRTFKISWTQRVKLMKSVIRKWDRIGDRFAKKMWDKMMGKEIVG
jgi:hypothetical protein